MNNHKEIKEYRFLGFTLAAATRKLTGAGNKVVPLSSRAFDTLLILVRHQGQTLSKSFLLETVWPGAVVEENNLNQAIFTLRKALGDSKENSLFIQTIPGRGYCFVAEVEAESAGTKSQSDDIEQSGETAVLPTRNTGFTLRPLKKSWIASAAILVTAVTGLFILRNQESDPQTGITALAESSQWQAIPDSLAVLPFTSINPGSENELFIIGLHDEINSQLAKISSIKVIARDSVMTLVDQGLSLQAIGKKLRVKSAITGSVMFVGEHARINLQMLDPMTGIAQWSESYEANTNKLSDMISIQSTIALHVANALQAEIKQPEHDLITAIPTRSFEAYRFNLAAKNAHYNQDFATEWSLSRQALELDPVYRDALYNFSAANTVLLGTPLPGLSSKEHYELAMESANKLIEIAPQSSDGYALKAVALSSNRDWEGVVAQIDKLMELGMPLSEMKFVSLALMCLGEFSQAIEIYNANLVTEPINLFGRGFLMGAYEIAGQREKSREEFLIGEELSPLWWGDTVNIFLSMGRHEPLADIDQILMLSEPLRHLLHNIENPEVISKGVQQYLQQDNKFSAEAIYYSALAARLGEHESAISLLRIALQDVWTGLWWVWLPVFDETRKTAGFRELIEESGVVDYWRNHGWPEVCQPIDDSFSCDWQAFPND